MTSHLSLVFICNIILSYGVEHDAALDYRVAQQNRRRIECTLFTVLHW